VDEARSYYAGSPAEPTSYVRKLEEVRRRFGRPERQAAAAALRPVSARARERLDAFVEHGGAMVTTGQQAGFLTGPLYTIHKALSTVRLAATLEQQLRVPILPVFWIASEDHDWAEVDHAFLSDGRSVRRVQLPSVPLPPLPMSERVLGEGLDRVLDEVVQVIGSGAFAPDVLKWIRDAYAPGRTVAAAFGELLARLLEPFDVCLADAADPAVKAASLPVLERALLDAEAQADRLRARSAALEAAGYHAQVGRVDGATTLFHHGPAGRERLDRFRGGLRAGVSGPPRPAEAWLEELRASPGRFSPNALLRPVVESWVFPTLAYLGGPAELAYFAQSSVLFADLGVMPPVATPRASVLLVEERVRRQLTRLGLEVPDLARPRHELETELARRAVPPALRAGVEALGAAVAEAARPLIEAAADVDPGLAGELARLRNEMLLQVAESERRVVRRVRQRERATLARLDEVLSQLRPCGTPQERVLNALPFVARHGPQLLERIAAAIRPAVAGGPGLDSGAAAARIAG
jgi:bacillithiol biosynthesis cysteine-adding enzyme BshC